MGKITFFHSRRRVPMGKILLIMRLSIVLLLISFHVSAKNFAQNFITLQVTETKLTAALKKIERNSSFRFYYSDDVLPKDKLVNLSVNNADINDVLKLMLEGTSLSWKMLDGNRVVIGRFAALSQNNFQQSVSGVIRDQQGNPLEGVSVSVKGTNRGTSTGADGHFSIAANPGDVLLVSMVGFQLKEVVVTEQTTVNVVLNPVDTKMDEVVVVGFGTQKKVNLTGSVSVVKGSDLENRPVMNATQSLQGMIPGLNISVGTSTKPGQSFNLNVRGVGNLAGGDAPFVLVDGMPMNLSDVNPNDIESISVLKDAAASAVYGARAPFGVILITTKKGKADKTTINYSNNIAFASPINLPDMVNSYDFATYFNAATYNAIGSRQYSDEKLALLKQYVQNPKGMNIFPEATDNYLSNWENTANGVANTDWFDFHYKPYSGRQMHNLSVSGGNKTTQYFISGGIYNEDGLLRYADIDYKRLNFNSTITSQVTSWAKLRLNTKLTQDKYTAPFSNNGTFETLFFHNLARMRPNISPYDLNGNFNEISSVPYFRSGSEAINRNFTLAILPGLELEPVKNWKIIADLNVRRDQGESSTLLLPGTIYGIDGTPKLVNRSEYAIPLGGSYSRTESTNLYVSPNIYTSYRYVLNRDHDFNVMVGFQQELNQYRSLSSSAQDLISAGRPGISLTTGTPTTQEARNHWATRGYFGRFTYNYQQKYLLEINGRYDGSSRFASDNRWGFFPSASIGYNIAKESFMENIQHIVNNLKIRASYGLLGNQSGAGMYSYLQTMGISVPGINGAGPSWYFQNGREAVIYAPAPFNSNTTWEKVYTKNLGLDIDLLKNKISASFDLYQRETRDMLGPTFDIADLFGGTVPASNNANLRTNGWELTLSYRGRIADQVNFSITGVISDNQTEVTRYENPTNTDPSGSWYVGKKVGEIWGYRADGLIQTAEDAAAFNALDHSFLSPVAWQPGDVRYLDLNKDGKINRGNNRLGDMGDMVIIGNSSSRYLYSLNAGFDWKRISLSFLIQGVGKRQYAPGVGDVYFWGSGALAQVTVFKEHMDYWREDNRDAYYPNPYASPAGSISSYTSKVQQASDRYLQNAAYLRLKNVTLSYALPTELVQRIKLNRLSVFASGENIFTITKLKKMFDPETLNSLNGNTTGKIYPLSRVFSFGINVGL